MAKGIKRKLQGAIEGVNKDLYRLAYGRGEDSFYSAGLANEGWLGGYRQAL